MKYPRTNSPAAIASVVGVTVGFLLSVVGAISMRPATMMVSMACAERGRKHLEIARGSSKHEETIRLGKKSS